MPVLIPLIVGVAAIGGTLLGISKLDDISKENARKRFEKDVAYLKSKGFNNDQIALIMKNKL